MSKKMSSKQRVDRGGRGAGLPHHDDAGRSGAPVSIRERYLILQSVHADLEAAGCSIDVGQLDWASKEIERRLAEKSLDEQWRYELARAAGESESDEAHREYLRQMRDWHKDSGV